MAVIIFDVRVRLKILLFHFFLVSYSYAKTRMFLQSKSLLSLREMPLLVRVIMSNFPPK